MATLTKPRTSAAHWYAADGTPRHRLPTRDGRGERATRIDDARELGLFPSVTSILGVLAKPGLDNWRMDQAALAAVRVERAEGESDSYWCRRVRDTAFEQVDEAADLGRRIHDALERAFAGEPYDDDLRPYVEPVIAWRDSTAVEIVERERTLVNPAEGFGGTMDVAFRFGKRGVGVLDYKTRKTKPGEDVRPYDGQAMQLAAYAATYWGDAALDRCVLANVFISTTEPGRIHVHKHTHPRQHWDAFRAACALWRYQKDYDPRMKA